MAIGDKIKTLRKEKKWSQDELSRLVNVHCKHISRYENGKAAPGPDILKKLAEAFEVSVDYLIYDNVPKHEKIKIDDPELLEQFEMVNQLKEEEKKAIKIIINALIMKNQMENVVTKR